MTVFITYSLLPSLNIPSVYIQHFTFLPQSYFELFWFPLLVKHISRVKTIVCAKLKKWNNGLMFRHWILNAGVSYSKQPGGSKVNSAYHPSPSNIRQNSSPTTAFLCGHHKCIGLCACKWYFCDINVSCIFILNPAFFKV